MKKRKLKVGAEKIKKENKTKPIMIYSNVLWAGSVCIISNVMIGHGFATFSFIFEIKTWFLCNNPEFSWSGPRFLEDHRTIPNNYCYYDCRMQSFGTGSVPHCIRAEVSISIAWTRHFTVEPRYNEPLYNKVLGITNDFLYPSNSKICEKEPRCSEHILPVPWPFVKSRFHCNTDEKIMLVIGQHKQERNTAGNEK